MAGTFQTRVQSYLGTGYSETVTLSDNLTAGAKYITDLLPEDKIDRFGADLTDSGSGVSVTGHRVIRAHKAGYRASRIDAGLKTQAASAGSIYTSSTIDPSWYIENGKGYVLPSGGTIVGVAYPTVAYGDLTISNFPTELEHGVVLYAVIQGCISQINAGKDALNALSYATITPPSVPLALTISSAAPTAPLDSSYSYTDAILGTYTATTIGSLGIVPTYTKPTTTFSITAANTYVATNQDLERAKSEIDNQNTLLNQYNLDIQNEQNEFNKELEVYKSTFQTAIRQAELDQERLIVAANKTTDLSIQNKAQSLNAAISLYKDKLQKFVSQIDLYQASVNSEIQLYAQNLGRLQGQLQLYSSQIQDAQIKYNSDQQKYTGQINHYNSILQGVKKEYEDFLKGRL